MKLINFWIEYDTQSKRTINKFKTIKKGMHYNAPIVQLVPDCLVNVSNLGIDSIIVRMDLKHNEKVLAEQLKVCNCSIVSDQQVNLDLLKAFKPKIKEFVYFVKKENHNPEFIKELTKIGFPVILMSEMDDEDIDSVKLYYMDYGLIQKADRSSDEEIEKIKVPLKASFISTFLLIFAILFIILALLALFLPINPDKYFLGKPVFLSFATLLLTTSFSP